MQIILEFLKLLVWPQAQSQISHTSLYFHLWEDFHGLNSFPRPSPEAPQLTLIQILTSTLKPCYFCSQYGANTRKQVSLTLLCWTGQNHICHCCDPPQCSVHWSKCNGLQSIVRACSIRSRHCKRQSVHDLRLAAWWLPGQCGEFSYWQIYAWISEGINLVISDQDLNHI